MHLSVESVDETVNPFGVALFDTAHQIASERAAGSCRGHVSTAISAVLIDTSLELPDGCC
jgi:hypothetical protein